MNTCGNANASRYAQHRTPGAPSTHCRRRLLLESRCNGLYLTLKPLQGLLGLLIGLRRTLSSLSQSLSGLRKEVCTLLATRVGLADLARHLLELLELLNRPLHGLLERCGISFQPRSHVSNIEVRQNTPTLLYPRPCGRM